MHSLEADKSLPDEERTLVGLIFPPSWSQRSRRTEKLCWDVCVCVGTCTSSAPQPPGEGQAAGPGQDGSNIPKGIVGVGRACSELSQLMCRGWEEKKALWGLDRR